MEDATIVGPSFNSPIIEDSIEQSSDGSECCTCDTLIKNFSGKCNIVENLEENPVEECRTHNTIPNSFKKYNRINNDSTKNIVKDSCGVVNQSPLKRNSSTNTLPMTNSTAQCNKYSIDQSFFSKNNVTENHYRKRNNTGICMRANNSRKTTTTTTTTKGSCAQNCNIESTTSENTPRNTIRVIPLHRSWDYLDSCFALLETEWPTSIELRMHKLRQSRNHFPTSLVLVLTNVEGEEHVVGHARINPIKGIDEACFIESVVISENQRGKGWGTFLMMETEGYMMRRAVTIAYLTTTDKEKFYNKMGYLRSEPLTLYGTLSKNKNQLFIKNVFPGLDVEYRMDTGKSYPIYHAEATSSRSMNVPCPPLPPPLPVFHPRLKVFSSETIDPHEQKSPKITMKKFLYPEEDYCYGDGCCSFCREDDGDDDDDPDYVPNDDELKNRDSSDLEEDSQRTDDDDDDEWETVEEYEDGDSDEIDENDENWEDINDDLVDTKRNKSYRRSFLKGRKGFNYSSAKKCKKYKYRHNKYITNRRKVKNKYKEYAIKKKTYEVQKRKGRKERTKYSDVSTVNKTIREFVKNLAHNKNIVFIDRTVESENKENPVGNLSVTDKTVDKNKIMARPVAIDSNTEIESTKKMDIDQSKNVLDSKRRYYRLILTSEDADGVQRDEYIYYYSEDEDEDEDKQENKTKDTGHRESNILEQKEHNEIREENYDSGHNEMEEASDRMSISDEEGDSYDGDERHSDYDKGENYSDGYAESYSYDGETFSDDNSGQVYYSSSNEEEYTDDNETTEYSDGIQQSESDSDSRKENYDKSSSSNYDMDIDNDNIVNESNSATDTTNGRYSNDADKNEEEIENVGSTHALSIEYNNDDSLSKFQSAHYYKENSNFIEDGNGNIDYDDNVNVEDGNNISLNNIEDYDICIVGIDDIDEDDGTKIVVNDNVSDSSSKNDSNNATVINDNNGSSGYDADSNSSSGDNSNVVSYVGNYDVDDSNDGCYKDDVNNVYSDESNNSDNYATNGSNDTVGGYSDTKNSTDSSSNYYNEDSSNINSNIDSDYTVTESLVNSYDSDDSRNTIIIYDSNENDNNMNDEESENNSSHIDGDDNENDIIMDYSEDHANEFYIIDNTTVNAINNEEGESNGNSENNNTIIDNNEDITDY